MACARLGAFAVREVACGVADAQRVIRRCITCAEARAAECGFHDGARRHEVGNGALCEQVHKHWLRGRVDVQCEFALTALRAL